MVVGIDEAGRGCWAGPLVAAAVVLGEPIEGLNDSKKLSALRRKQLAIEIQAKASGVGIGIVSPEEVDQLGLTAATSKAMAAALAAINGPFDQVLIDGNYNYLPQTPNVITEIKADAKYDCVSAASIIAKVTRDEIMHQAAIEYPNYGFEKHVGYGTAAHIAALKAHGPCTLHRLSYRPVKAIMELRSVIV